MALNWRGDRIKQRMGEAQRVGVNAIMSQAVIHAKQHHPWITRSGTLEGETKILQYAHEEGAGWRGVWGVGDANYALPLELGLGMRREYPFLRPAADATYGGLADRIRREYER